jgi:hypothetical protein
MQEKEASLLTYNTVREKFESVYERNKFYRGLFGYRQTVRKNGKEYEYDKDGLMDRICCVRIDDSVFVVAKQAIEEVEEYFSDWGDRVNYRLFRVVLEDPDLIDRMEENTQ